MTNEQWFLTWCKISTGAVALYLRSPKVLPMNPLISFPERTHGTLSFGELRPEHFMPALTHWMSVAKERQAQIVANEELPNFVNTVEALEFSTLELDRVSSCFFNLYSAETSEEIQKIAREFSPALTAFGNETLLNKPLFERIKAVYDRREEEVLTPEQVRLLEETYQGFVRNGALLEGVDRETLMELSATLSTRALQFGEHVLAHTQAFKFNTKDVEELRGLPEDVVELARQKAEEEGETGYSFGLDMPTYMAIMKYAEDSNLRKFFYIAYNSRAAQNNEWNNEQTIADLVNTRLAKAQLLGFENHASFILSKRMAKDEQTVFQFLEELKKVAKPAAQKEVEEVRTFAQERGALELHPWDFSYWSEQLKLAKYALDDELLKPYFSLEKVLDGAFQVSGKLYGLTFERNSTIEVYHPDVHAYEVFDRAGALLAVLYTDFFPRPGKRAGAWMTSYKSMYTYNGVEERPHISIVCNFTKPTATKPSLLTFNEVTTLFHEFGHALHGMLARGTYPSLTGTSVYWDFVELPSQIFENWCYEEEALALFAHHYQSGELIKSEYIQRLKQIQTYLEGYMTLRQLNFGFLDMAWHTLRVPFDGQVVSFEEQATADTSLFTPVQGTLSSTAFSHIFQGGYSAGYYSYKWAEVLDADAFQYFKEEGLFNEAVAAKFEKLLSSGGTVAPEVLYREFRGRDPKVTALLKRAGLLN